MDTIRTNYHHYTDVKGLKINGTAITATASELNIMDGVVSSASEVDQFVLTGEIANISSAGSSWVVSPYAGTIEKIYTVIDGAITVHDAAITFEIDGTAVTDAGITIAYSGSGAGTVDSSEPSAKNSVDAGDAIEIITDGGSTDAAKAVVVLVMQRS